jgi:hypothetical protein
MSDEQRTANGASGKDRSRYFGPFSMCSCFSRAGGPSEESREHFRQAGVELMKALRQILKDQIDKNDGPRQKPKPIIL